MKWYNPAGMINVEKHVKYWRDGATDDFAVAGELVTNGRIRHGLFFAHLALEKLLKALVCRNTGALAPKMHDLMRLSQISGLSMSQEQVTFLARFGRFQIEGRYPEVLDPEPSREHAEQDLRQVEELFSWLTTQL